MNFEINRKNGTLILAVVLSGILVFGFNNCTFEVQKSLNTVSGLDERLEGQKLYTNNCVGCHGPIEASTKRDKTAMEISNAIQTQPQMRFLQSLTSYEIQLIAVALSTPVVPPTDDLDVKLASEVEARVGNRYAITSMFQEVFISTDLDANDRAIAAAIKANISDRPEAFGGGCTRYDEGCVPQVCGIEKPDLCLAAVEVRTQAAAAPPSNVMAKGYMVRTCEEILAIDKSVGTALRKAQLYTSGTLPNPDANNIAAFMTYYFRDRPTSTEAVAANLAIAADAAGRGMDLLDQWRFTVLAICQSSSADLL